MVTAGYDLGGAHLKVALAEGGRVLAAEQIVCPLWQGLGRLDEALGEAGPLIGQASRHAATMTGELCELFPDRATGVAALVDRIAGRAGAEVRIWLGPHGFGSAEEARRSPSAAASMNFLATGELVARRLGDGLLIDIGSTTTDIVPVVGGRACPRALDDGGRLATGELVYSGLTRTDVAAVAHKVPFRGQSQRLAAGSFATMADVRRVLGELPEGVDLHETADRRGKSVEESVSRLARCLGRDAADASLADWRRCARALADAQMRDLRDACREVLAATPLSADAPVIAAGIGAPVVEALADELDRPCRLFGDLVQADARCRVPATRCASAVAVALLAEAG